jgi:hypothetical protein
LDWILKVLTHYSATADLHTLQFTTAPAMPFPAYYVFNSRSLATALTVAIIQLLALRSFLFNLPCRTFVSSPQFPDIG